MVCLSVGLLTSSGAAWLIFYHTTTGAANCDGWHVIEFASIPHAYGRMRHLHNQWCSPHFGNAWVGPRALFRYCISYTAFLNKLASSTLLYSARTEINLTFRPTDWLDWVSDWLSVSVGKSGDNGETAFARRIMLSFSLIFFETFSTLGKSFCFFSWYFSTLVVDLLIYLQSFPRTKNRSRKRK